ncbi:MAG: TMEM43 family protein [Mailhella sp.]|nr:TMEM43 family protein [Mailhella sp.]
MAYTETTSTGWFSRIGSSFKGMGFGLAAIIAGTCLLWWNEGSFVATRDALNETQAITEELGDVASLNAAMNGKVVHATGTAATNDVLSDPEFGVSENAISLSRHVEYYQWVENSKTEKRKKLGGGEETVTVYTYDKQWVSAPVNSDNFKDPEARKANRNSLLMNIKDERWSAKNVSFGAYNLPDFFISAISGQKTLDISLPQETLDKLNESILRVHPELIPSVLPPLPVYQSPNAPAEAGQAPAVQDTPPLPVYQSPNAPAEAGQPRQPAPAADGAAALEQVKDAAGQLIGQALNKLQYVRSKGNTIYVGASEVSPQIGDVRVTYKAVPERADISILAKLNGNTFERITASNGKTVSKLSMGAVSMEGMYGQAHSGNSTMTWALRVLGTIIVIAGLKILLAPLAVIGDVVPILGSIIGAGTGFISTLIGLAWSLIIMAIAWLRFRPAIGGAMIGVAALLIVLVLVRGRGKKTAAAQA